MRAPPLLSAIQRQRHARACARARASPRHHRGNRCVWYGGVVKCQTKIRKRRPRHAKRRMQVVINGRSFVRGKKRGDRAGERAETGVGVMQFFARHSTQRAAPAGEGTPPPGTRNQPPTAHATRKQINTSLFVMRLTVHNRKRLHAKAAMVRAESIRNQLVTPF